MNSMRELKTEARVDCLNQVMDFLNSCLEELECPMRASMQINVAVEEIFVNIASYAYAPGTGQAIIRVEAEPDVPAVRITFLDSGVPFDPLERTDPDVSKPAAERQIGGLGIYMVKKSMDSVEYAYRDGQNQLSIVKRF